MSQQYRHRMAGAVFAALVAAVPLFAAEVAYADRASGGGQVVFDDGDGVLGLSCAADPEVTAIIVAAESTLQVVNETDHEADLLLDGKSQGAIPPNGTARVVFHRGPVALTVRPDCVLSRESEPVVVTVAPSAPSTSTAKRPCSSAASSTRTGSAAIMTNAWPSPWRAWRRRGGSLRPRHLRAGW